MGDVALQVAPYLGASIGAIVGYVIYRVSLAAKRHIFMGETKRVLHRENPLHDIGFNRSEARHFVAETPPVELLGNLMGRLFCIALFCIAFAMAGSFIFWERAIFWF